MYRKWPRTAFLSALSALLGLQAVVLLPWDLSALVEAIVWIAVAGCIFEVGASLVTIVSDRAPDRSQLSWGSISGD